MVNTDRFQRRAADGAADPPKIVLLRGAQITSARGRMQLDLPQDFIGHPVAYSRKNGLIEQHGLDRRTAPPVQVFPQHGLRKSG